MSSKSWDIFLSRLPSELKAATDEVRSREKTQVEDIENRIVALEQRFEIDEEGDDET